jgi:hypothetical protein
LPLDRGVELLRCSQEQVWIRLCVSNLIARERSKVDRCCFPAAGRDCPRYCGLNQPDERLARARQGADLARVSLIGLGVTPPQQFNALGINFDFDFA